MMRFQRYKEKYARTAGTLEDFVNLDDAVNYGRATNRSLKVIHTFFNAHISVDAFNADLSSKIRHFPFNLFLFFRVQLCQLGASEAQVGYLFLETSRGRRFEIQLHETCGRRCDC